MSIAYTPALGLAYCDPNTPLVDLATVTQQTATTVEAALVSRGIAPADVQTLIAAGWFVDTGWKTYTAADLALATGWTTTASVYRVRSGVVWQRLRLTSPSSLAWTADAVGNLADVQIATVPAGQRPTAGGGDVHGLWGRPGFAMAGGVSLSSAGGLSVRGWFPGQAVPAGVDLAFQFSYPL